MHTSKPTEVLLVVLITITLLFISPSCSVPTRPAWQKLSKYMKPIISPTSNQFSTSRSRSLNSSFVKPSPVISNSITLKYIQPEQGKTEGKGSVVTMNLQTLYPVLNIDDLRGLYNISCPVTPDPDSEFEDISIQLSDVSLIGKWPKNMLLLVGHQWSCGINVSVKWKLVENVKVVDEEMGLVVLNTKKVETDDVVVKCRIVVEEVESYQNEDGPDKPNNGFHGTADHPGSKIKRRDSTSQLNLNLNYDPKSSRSKRQISFPTNLRTGAEFSWTCENCYTTGSALLVIDFEKEPSKEKNFKWSFKLSGDLNVNVEYKLGSNKQNLYEKDFGFLFSIPVGPLTVPGLFNLGYSFYVSSGVTVSVNDTALFRHGFDVNFPDFSVDIFKPFDDDDNLPNIETSGFIPTITPHDFTIPEAVLLSLGFRLSPGINFGFELGNGLINAGVSIEIDNYLFADVEDSNGDVCPAETCEVSYKYRHVLQLNALGRSKDILGTEKKMICPTCGICLGPGSISQFRAILPTPAESSQEITSKLGNHIYYPPPRPKPLPAPMTVDVEAMFEKWWQAPLFGERPAWP